MEAPTPVTSASVKSWSKIHEKGKNAIVYHGKEAPLVSQTVQNLPTMRDPSSIPGLGRYPGEGNGNPRQCSGP